MQKTASSAMIRMSQASASWNPAPMAWPCTAAMEMKFGSRRNVNPAWYSSIVRAMARSVPWIRPATVSPSVASSSIDRSSPAEKLGPSARMTRTRTSAGIARASAASARHIAGVCALRRAGLHSTISATESLAEKLSPAVRNSAAVGVVAAPWRVCGILGSIFGVYLLNRRGQFGALADRALGVQFSSDRCAADQVYAHAERDQLVVKVALRKLTRAHDDGVHVQRLRAAVHRNVQAVVVDGVVGHARHHPNAA